MKKTIKFLAYSDELSNVTQFYINIIIQALKDIQSDIIITDNVKNINKNDIVFVITLKAALKLWIKHPHQKIMIWIQGALPEELKFAEKGLWNFCKRITYNYLEKIVLKKSLLTFFVSQSMVEHQKEKWHYNSNQYIIMPCFNTTLEEQSFFYPHKYKNLSFVFAGGIGPWHCLEQCVILFSKIKKEKPQATLTILSKEKDAARKILSKYNVDAKIDFFDLKDLNSELAKYKYGFLLREELLLNHVATPTKLSTYLSNGIIPIFSNVIGDFKNMFSESKYKIQGDVSNLDLIIENIYKFEQEPVEIQEILKDYKNIFLKYYNIEIYSKEIVKKLGPLLQ